MLQVLDGLRSMNAGQLALARRIAAPPLTPTPTPPATSDAGTFFNSRRILLAGAGPHLAAGSGPGLPSITGYAAPGSRPSTAGNGGPYGGGASPKYAEVGSALARAQGQGAAASLAGMVAAEGGAAQLPPYGPGAGAWGAGGAATTGGKGRSTFNNGRRFYGAGR